MKWCSKSVVRRAGLHPLRLHSRTCGHRINNTVVSGRDFSDALLTAPGSLGVLDRTIDRLAALPRPHLGTATLVLVGADHRVAAHGVSAYPASVTRPVMSAAVVGESVGAAAARSSGMHLIIVDAGVNGPPVPGARHARARHPVGDLVTTNPLHRLDVERLFDFGRDFGKRAARDGAVALGEVGVGNTTVAAALAAVLLYSDPSEVVGLRAGAADTDMLQRKHQVLRGSLVRAVDTYRAGLADQLTTQFALGGPEFVVARRCGSRPGCRGAPGETGQAGHRHRRPAGSQDGPGHRRASGGRSPRRVERVPVHTARPGHRTSVGSRDPRWRRSRCLPGNRAAPSRGHHPGRDRRNHPIHPDPGGSSRFGRSI